MSILYKSGKLNVIIDGQWGSTGKGKVAGYLALRETVDVVVCDFMPNAGHTFVYDDGTKLMLQQLPMSVVNCDCLVLIAPTANITLEILLRELETVPSVAKRLMIHPHAGIIEPQHVSCEKKNLERISSTCKGCGAASADKVMRKLKLAKDVPELKEFIGDTAATVRMTILSGGTAVMEAAQGFGLSLNYGQYPYVTSRDVTTMTALNSAGVGPRHVGSVIGCLRTYPIRVGNVVRDGECVGYSGPAWGGQGELTWEEITKRSGSLTPIEERTTVTNKIRRVFSFSYHQFSEFLHICEPTHLFVNFANYLNAGDYGIASWQTLSEQTRNWVKKLNGYVADEYQSLPNSSFAPHVALIGTGPKDSHMVETWHEEKNVVDW